MAAADPAGGEPAATGPGWQQELAAARLAEATVELAPASDSPETRAVRQRLDELYRTLSARYPNQEEIRRAAGDHFSTVGDQATAESEWRAAQALDPGDAEVSSSLGAAALAKGKTKAALVEFQWAVDARPQVARHHFDLANVLFLFRHEFVGLSGLPDEAAVAHAALRHYELAATLEPGSVDYARSYAETFYGVPNPDWTAGLAAWQHVRALTAGNPDVAIAHLARISLRLGKPDDAEGYLALIHDSRFEPSKASILKQAERMKQAAPTPAPSGR